MIEVEVRPIGDSLGIVLPVSLLERLGLKDGDSLYFTEAFDGSMRVTVYDPNFESQMRAAREGVHSYRNVLHALAK